MVDLVVIDDDDSPEELLNAVRPDLLIGGNTQSDVAGADLVQTWGGRVMVAGRLAETAEGLNRRAGWHAFRSSLPTGNIRYDSVTKRTCVGVRPVSRISRPAVAGRRTDSRRRRVAHARADGAGKMAARR